MRYLILLPAIFLTVVSVQATNKSKYEKVTFKFANKGNYVFQQGQPIIFDLIIQNLSADEIVLCGVGYDLYNLDLKVNCNYIHYKVDGLLMPKRSHEFKMPFQRDTLKTNEGCDNSFDRQMGLYKIVIKAGETAHYPVLLADFLHYDYYRTQEPFGLGIYKKRIYFPCGNYEYKMYLPFSDGSILDITEKFKIVDTDLRYSSDLEMFTDILTKNNTTSVSNKNVINLDSTEEILFYKKLDKNHQKIKDKVLLNLLTHPFSRYYLTNESNLDFYLKEIFEIDNFEICTYLLQYLVNLKRFNATCNSSDYSEFTRVDLYKMLLAKFSYKKAEMCPILLSLIKTSINFGGLENLLPNAKFPSKPLSMKEYEDIKSYGK